MAGYLKINLKVVAHADEDHKDGYKCGYTEGAEAVPCDKEFQEKGLMYRHVKVTHLRKFNKLCKYPNCDWDGCDEEATRLYHYVQKHDESILKLPVKLAKGHFLR